MRDRFGGTSPEGLQGQRYRTLPRVTGLDELIAENILDACGRR
jgi:hypothetical protein